MKRRQLLHLPFAAMLATPARATSSPWSARLLVGGFDGTAWNAGFAVTLEGTWKTYWRVPGDGGIAPAFELKGENIKSSRVDYPSPKRFKDEAGVTIGYKNQVVFPLAIEPLDISKPVKVNFSVFFGVCEVVCIPAQFAGDLSFDPAISNAPDQIEISKWKNAVPVAKPQSVANAPVVPIAKATAILDGDQVALKLDMVEAVTDIFVEGDAKHYFGEPILSLGQAQLKVHGAKTLDDLRNQRLRVTLVMANAALEQMVTVV